MLKSNWIIKLFSYTSAITGIVGCQNQKTDTPNILWISCEDITTMLGCYGDENATTPNLDAFARKSVRFTNAFSTAAVSSPSRSCIITGVYATSLGSQHLRSEVEIPDFIIPFPKLLREKGYYVTNNYKEDYSFTDTTIWNNSSKTAHWNQRKDDQPFFSVFNLEITHQSAIFGNDSVYNHRIQDYKNNIIRTDPAKLKLPPYYPDSPVIRSLWARYYTNVSIMDYQFGEILKELEKDGLADNTIIFFFSDHGTGMPRSKRALYDSGLKIPLLIYFPEKYAGKFNIVPGTVDKRMVSFVDFAPTVLEIAGIDISSVMQGKSFVSARKLPESNFVFGTSDRVDEAYELVRTIRTPEFRYIRNYFPFNPLLQPNYYTDKSEIMKELEKFRHDKDLTAEQLTLFKPERSPEELYDIINDPDEVYNLAEKPEYYNILKSLREQLNQEILRTYDTGFMPEPEMDRLTEESTPYEVARDTEIYPLKDILSACDLILRPTAETHTLIENLHNTNGFVRYWSVIAIESMKLYSPEIIGELNIMLTDDFPTVQIEAAKTLLKSGDKKAMKTILNLMNSKDDQILLYAARAFEETWRLLPEVPPEFYNMYEKLKKSTAGKWYGHDLYAFWALSEVNEEITADKK